MGYAIHAFVMLSVVVLVVFVLKLCHQSKTIGDKLTSHFGSRREWDMSYGPGPLFCFPLGLVTFLLLGFIFAGNILHLFLFYVGVGAGIVGVTLLILAFRFALSFAVKKLDGEE